MAGVGTKIAAIDYNNIQSTVSQVLGTGSGQFGYGQPVASSQVSTNSKISVTQWNNLRNDLLKCRRHQTTVDESAELIIPTTSTSVTDAARANYLTFANRIALAANRLASPPGTEATRVEVVLPHKQRTASWNNTLTQTITVDFGSPDAARFYFNTGSSFIFSGEFIPSASNPKNNSWQTLLANMGEITFNHTETTAASGTPTAIGWYDLTTSNQTIFTKTVELSTYNPNRYRIQASRDSTSQILYFTITFEDSYAPGGWGVDELVTGTLTSKAFVRRASGTNVSVPKPGATVSEIV